MKKLHNKRQSTVLCALCVVVLAAASIFLAGCFPSNLEAGLNNDPRRFKDYPEYEAFDSAFYDWLF